MLMGKDRGMAEESNWRSLLSLARESTAQVAGNEKVQDALGKSKDVSKKAAVSAGKGLDKTRKVVTLEEEWSEAEAALAELAELARVHHALISSLMDRVDQLEQMLSHGRSDVAR